MGRKTKLPYDPSWHYMFRVNTRSTGIRYEICSKSRREMLEQYQSLRSEVLIANVLSSVLIVDFEHAMPVGIVKTFFIITK